MRSIGSLNRRHLLQASAAAGGLGLLGGCATVLRPAAYQKPIAPIRASANRIFDITVCLRPFRAQGPRLETERLGNTLVVHNYGHGGSGWSLSWGSSTLAVQMAMAGSPREIAVVGCGALGLTSAILAQEAGAQVTVYARDPIAGTRSSRATGIWSPDSRIALADRVAPDFPARWEQMARTSFKHYRRYLGLPGSPVEWMDNYFLRDDPLAQTETPQAATTANPPALEFAEYNHLIRDLTPHSEELPPGSTPFPTDHVRRGEQMVFNVADYGHTLMNDFLIAGGKFKRMEFHEPSELTHLKEKVVINCPGYGARALWKDETVTPVRGQIAWLIPQQEVNYMLYYNRVGVVPRRDGIVVQAIGIGDMEGFGNDNETPDRAEAEKAVGVIAELYARMSGKSRS